MIRSENVKQQKQYNVDRNFLCIGFLFVCLSVCMPCQILTFQFFYSIKLSFQVVKNVFAEW